MFEDDQEHSGEEAADPTSRADEHAERFRMHAELAAVFDGPRKFDAQVLPTLDADLAREVQKSIGKLEKSREVDSPLIPQPSAGEAAAVLNFFATHELSTNNYHVYRRPGEVMIIRWLIGEEVETFYTRLQAHFDAAINAFREDEHQSKAWKQDPATLAYLTALDTIEVKMADRYLREIIRQHRVYLMTTQTADEINIAYLTDTIMGVSPAELVGKKSAPPDEPSEDDLAWFFKLFSLRGIVEGIERMCFFAYLQKSDDLFESDD